jgi:crotonobetainyl-CoA:carnitine CoA-transferase CaiB-like acyl-CoA transferase
MAAVGVLAGCIFAKKTGKGQYVDISLLDGVFSWLNLLVAEYVQCGKKLNRGDTFLSGRYACYGVYKTKDNRYITLGCLETRFWQNIVKELQLPEEYIEYQFEDDQQEIMRISLEKKFLGRCRDEWIAFFNDKDICIGPVNSIEEAIKDPQLNFRDMLIKVPHDILGSVMQVGNAIKMSGMRKGDEVRLAPPILGADTDEVLKASGMLTHEIDKLRSKQII